MYVNSRWPGSAHDSFVFRTTSLYRHLEAEVNHLDDGIILGDSGYACTKYMMTPYRMADTRAKQAYNKAHSKTRVIVEMTFGRWKRRFGILHSEFRTADCLDVLFMIFGSLAAMVHGAGWPVLMIFFGDMTDQFIGVNTTDINVNDTAAVFDEFNTQMTEYSLYYVYIGAAVFVASFFQVSFWTMSCERQALRIRKQFFRAILRQEIGWFDVHQSGELTTRLADDLERVHEVMGDKCSYAIQFLAQFVSGFAIGFWKGWKLALVMMSLSPLLAIGGAFLSKFVANYSKREQDTYAGAGSVAEEVLSCIRTVTLFNGQNQDLKRYERSLEESKRIGSKKACVTGLGLGFTMLVMFSAYALAFWFGSEQVKNGEMSGGQVLTVFFCVLIGTFSIGNITPHVTSIAGAKGATAVLINIIDNDPYIDAGSSEGVVLSDLQGDIELRDVTFTYPTRGDVTVLVDGRDIHTLDLKSLRDRIGIVSQEPILFGISIKENILLGRPEATYADIIRAAKEANCHDFISNLPQGYDTLVGERGAQLSGGQKQRVAIARALIRDPKILLLDEATSTLDTQSERIVQEALDKARQGRTTIVIAHRLSTIQNADVINVVQYGEIVESGKHAELMARQGVYHQLVTVQMIIEEDDDISVEDDDGKQDAVPNGTRRQRSISGEKIPRQMSSQSSRQVSRQNDLMKWVEMHYH